MKLNGSNRKVRNQRRIHGSRTSMQGYVDPAPGTNITRNKPLTDLVSHHREHSFLHLKCLQGKRKQKLKQRGREEGEGIRPQELCEQGRGAWALIPYPILPPSLMVSVEVKHHGRRRRGCEWEWECRKGGNVRQGQTKGRVVISFLSPVSK